MTTFLHTADWQLGKPFSRVEDLDRQADLRRQRLDTIDRIGEVAREQEARFILVAGDVFDSPRPTDRLISAALERVGHLPVPVYLIPGNHDHAGPGCLWESPHFLKEQQLLAPNLTVLLTAEPFERDDCLLLPCPLLRRQSSGDPTGWIQSLDFDPSDARPRVVLAHGSTVNFQADLDDEDEPGQANFIDLARLSSQHDEIDYIALGDWHGFVQAGEKAWYAGSHETDRFPKNGQLPGHVACVKAVRGKAPEVLPIPTGAIAWFTHASTLLDSGGPEHLDNELSRLSRNAGVTRVVAKLELDGHLGLEDLGRLDALLHTWQARMVHLRVHNRVSLQPTDAELSSLTGRAEDPLIARVAASLATESGGDDEEARTASLALMLLYQQVTQPEAAT
ncbi:DNA repair exonuclease [bacterium]|nr:DNA repair exonuclease [bacterium]